MSQLLDSLRRRRHPAASPTAGSRHTAQRDSVLATLGYTAPTERARLYRTARIALLIGIGLMALAAWRVYFGTGPPRPAIVAPRSAEPPSGRR